MPYIEQWTVLRLQLNCHALSAKQYVSRKPASIGEIIYSLCRPLPLFCRLPDFGFYRNRAEMGRNIRFRPFSSHSSIFISGSTRKRKILTAARPCLASRARSPCRVNNRQQAFPNLSEIFELELHKEQIEMKALPLRFPISLKARAKSQYPHVARTIRFASSFSSSSPQCHKGFRVLCTLQRIIPEVDVVSPNSRVE